MRSTTSRRVLAGAAVMVAVAASSLAAPSAAQAAETCFGLTPTIVAPPGTPEVEGTDGDDVIVTEDASFVWALGGDDAVCATGDTRIDAGDGDDQVQSTATAGTKHVIVLGSGSDLFEGSDGRDRVYAEDLYDGYPTAGTGDENTDIIRTYGGADLVFTGARGFDGSVEPDHDQVDLGTGDDDVRLTTTTGGDAQVSGGSGRDDLSVQTPAGTASVLSVDLPAGTVTADGAGLATVTSFADVAVGSDADSVEVRGTDGPNAISISGHASIEAGGGNDDVSLYGDPRSVLGGPGHDEVTVAGYSDFDNKAVLYDLAHHSFTRGDVTAPFAAEKLHLRSTGQSPVHVRVLGTSGRDVVLTEGCGTVVRGAGGNDSLESHSEQCGRVPTTLYGGSGTDVLRGGPSHDVLLGGAGRDRASGGAGTDRCRAEVERGCELD